MEENLNESLLKQPVASILTEEQILDVDKKIASARNGMALMKGREEDIRSDLLLFTELKTIVKESLYVQRVANTEKEEAEIK